MKILENFKFSEESIDSYLNVTSSDEEITNYESFLLKNPVSKVAFPEFDEPYYTSLEYSLRHLLYKYENNWITSSRQVVHSTDECISNVHFVFNIDNKIISVNVFQRSSNINNLEDDIQFLNYFIRKYLKKDIELNVFVSMPHEFHKKKTKVD